MALIFVHPRFPKTKKAYIKAGDDNTDKLKKIMEKLIIDEAPKAMPTQQGASLAYQRQPQTPAWSYTDRKRKSKTFKL